MMHGFDTFLSSKLGPKGIPSILHPGIFDFVEIDSLPFIVHLACLWQRARLHLHLRAFDF
jgi:hypothetical protein